MKHPSLLSLANRGLILLGLAAVLPLWGQRQSSERIRVQVDVVPVDVVVTDEKGRPVPDLGKEDFILLEDGVSQEIAHFSLERFAQSRERGRNRPSDAAPADEKESLAAPGHRTLLILLGRGRHRYFDTLQSLIRFVREKLHPSDRVAVMAYNRSSDFTTNHQAVAAVLERYLDLHEGIEVVLENRFKGLAALYGRVELPESLQPQIEEIFAPVKALSKRTIPAVETPADRHQQGEQEILDIAQRRQERAANLESADVPVLLGPADQAQSAFDELERMEVELITDLPFDEYMERRARTNQDLMNVYAAIQYLGFMEGEKHLLFFTSEGLFLPHLEDDKSLTSMASDARVRLYTLHTGGVNLRAGIEFARGAAGTRREFAAAAAGQPAVGGSFSSSLALASLRRLSGLTGGQSFIGTDIGRALDHINRATSAVYLLGYRPKDRNFDGQFRHIQVSVKRKGVKIHARSGYYARPVVQPYDREEFLTYSRTVSAANYAEPVKDIAFAFDVMESQFKDGQTEFALLLKIGLTENMFAFQDQLYGGELAITSFVFSEDGDLLLDRWDKLDLKLTPPTYRKLLAEGIRLSRPLSVQGRLRKGQIKVVIYDPHSDRIGSAGSELEF